MTSESIYLNTPFELKLKPAEGILGTVLAGDVCGSLQLSFDRPLLAGESVNVRCGSLSYRRFQGNADEVYGSDVYMGDDSGPPSLEHGFECDLPEGALVTFEGILKEGLTVTLAPGPVTLRRVWARPGWVRFELAWYEGDVHYDLRVGEVRALRPARQGVMVITPDSSDGIEARGVFTEQVHAALRHAEMTHQGAWVKFEGPQEAWATFDGSAADA